MLQSTNGFKVIMVTKCYVKKYNMLKGAKCYEALNDTKSINVTKYQVNKVLDI